MAFKNTKLVLTFAVTTLLLLFSPFSFKRANVSGNNVEDQWPAKYRINSNQTWKGKIEISQNWLITSNGELTIEPGTEIIFHPNTAIFVKGSLNGRGQIANLIKIHGDESNSQYTIKVLLNGKVRIMNAEISQGGGTLNAFLSVKRTFWRKVYALIVNRIGAISVDSGGSFECQNCFFHDNKIAVYAGSLFGNVVNSISKVIVNRSSFEDNEKDVYRENTNGEFNFKYNWWGNENGPNMNKIVGDNIDIDYYRAKKDFKDPVIIIPGILGSQKIDGQWKIDPILKKYDKLYDTFLKNGYKKNKDAFTFPYDWRLDNIYTAELLKEKVLEIKKKTNWPKIDIVAHSMGGLIAREYIESDYYGDDVDQLILLGTPHLGAPKDYLIYQQGEEGFNKLGIAYHILKHLFKQEAVEKGYKNIYEYIHKTPISSVKELLPTYDYIYLLDIDKYIKSGKTVYNLLSYPYNYPRNEFLENLNKGSNLNKLKLVNEVNIIGKNNDTIVGINSLGLNKYDGIDFVCFQELRLGDGDGTVPTKSAKGIESDALVETNLSHSQLPEKTTEIVYKNITGKKLVKKIDSIGINNIFIIVVFSPIDIQIVAPDGKRVGKNFATGEYYNEINGAYYTGYKTDTEFITIPNPIDGEYKILTQGTDRGHYKIEATDISQNSDGRISEQTVTFEGEIITDEGKNHSVKIKNGIELKTQVDDESGNNNSDVGDADNINISNAESNGAKIVVDNRQNENVNNNENVGIENNDNLGDNSSNDYDRHKKHKKKVERKKSEKRLASIGTQAKNGLDPNNNEDAEKQDEKKVGENFSKKSIENNFVMGKETENKKNGNDFQSRSDNGNDKKSFAVSFGAIFLLGLVLIAGNLFGWLKVKDDRKQQDDEF